MKKKRKHLNGRGKGEFLYDYKHDILTFKIKDRKYKHSVEFQNFVSDIDQKGFVTGIRIFDASKVFGVDKYILKNIVNWEFKTIIENNVITVTFKFVSRIRNKIIPLITKEKDISQQLTAPIGTNLHLSDSSVKCPMNA